MHFDPQRTALVLIDLHEGVQKLSTAPHSAADVLKRSARLAGAFRKAGGLVVLVRVAFSPNGRRTFAYPLVRQPEDLVISKRQWNALQGTKLEPHLRRRGIDTIVLAGIATNLAVESTARAAHERDFSVVMVEDAMTSLSVETHAFSVRTVLPRLGQVQSTEVILDGLSAQDTAEDAW